MHRKPHWGIVVFGQFNYTIDVDSVLFIAYIIEFSVRPAKGVLLGEWESRPIRCQPHHR